MRIHSRSVIPINPLKNRKCTLENQLFGKEMEPPNYINTIEEDIRKATLLST
jgi:hypothetical protein